MLHKVIVNELPVLFDILGIQETPIPYVFSDDERGGLMLTPLGWVVRIPRHIADDSTETVAFYLHCLAHYILKHHTRKVKPLNQFVWDSAADYIANALLFKALLHRNDELRAKAPTIWRAIRNLYPYRQDWAHLSVEAVYHNLMLTTLNNKQKYEDEHTHFSAHGAGVSSNNATEGNAGDSTTYGVLGGSERRDAQYKTKILAARIPHTLQKELQQLARYEYTESLDLLQLSYNRIDTYWMSAQHMLAIHILDVSGSMYPILNKVATACWHTVNAIYNIWSGRAMQIVLWADVVRQCAWYGSEPDNLLKQKLLAGTGLGGTAIISACFNELNHYKKRHPLVIIYSDFHLMPNESDTAAQWLRDNKKFLARVIAIQTSNHYTSPIHHYIDAVIPIGDFFG